MSGSRREPDNGNGRPGSARRPTRREVADRWVGRTGAAARARDGRWPCTTATHAAAPVSARHRKALQGSRQRACFAVAPAEPSALRHSGGTGTIGVGSPGGQDTVSRRPGSWEHGSAQCSGTSSFGSVVVRERRRSEKSSFRNIVRAVRAVRAARPPVEPDPDTAAVRFWRSGPGGEPGVRHGSA